MSIRHSKITCYNSNFTCFFHIQHLFLLLLILFENCGFISWQTLLKYATILSLWLFINDDYFSAKKNKEPKLLVSSFSMLKSINRSTTGA